MAEMPNLQEPSSSGTLATTGTTTSIPQTTSPPVNTYTGTSNLPYPPFTHASAQQQIQPTPMSSAQPVTRILTTPPPNLHLPPGVQVLQQPSPQQTSPSQPIPTSQNSNQQIYLASSTAQLIHQSSAQQQQQPQSLPQSLHQQFQQSPIQQQQTIPQNIPQQLQQSFPLPQQQQQPLPQAISQNIHQQLLQSPPSQQIVQSQPMNNSQLLQHQTSFPTSTQQFQQHLPPDAYNIYLQNSISSQQLPVSNAQHLQSNPQMIQQTSNLAEYSTNSMGQPILTIPNMNSIPGTSMMHQMHQIHPQQQNPLTNSIPGYSSTPMMQNLLGTTQGVMMSVPGTPGTIHSAMSPHLVQSMQQIQPGQPIVVQNPSAMNLSGQLPNVTMIHPSIMVPNANVDPRTPRHKLRAAEVKLEISAKGLRDRDIATKSDPTCILFLEKKTITPRPVGYPAMSQQGGFLDTTGNQFSSPDGDEIEWEEHDRTECIKDDLNPHFKRHITVPYHFEELQHVRLGLWDIDSKSTELKKHDFLGEVKTTLGELVSTGVWVGNLTSPNERDTKGIFGGKRNLGTIRVIVHENRDGGALLIKAQLSGLKLDRKDVLKWKSDPYFLVTQVGESDVGSRTQLYQSETVRRNINPMWKPFQITATVPKGGGKSDMLLEFLVYSKDSSTRNAEIGLATLSVEELGREPVLDLKRSAKKKSRLPQKKNSGTLKFQNVRVLEMPSLVDYLQGGLKLHFSVAIDLTKSNGPPSDPLSLHYRESIFSTNRYIRALTAIANVLRVYIPTNDYFAAFGFGAELPGNPGMTSSCFPLGLTDNPHCIGVEGILEAYTKALSQVTLSGPTNFAPLIDTVSRMAAQRPNTQSDQNYDVLLILTDGVVSDYQLTVDRIVTASRTVPLSIIIVGIGNFNFKKMHLLDADNTLLVSSNGQQAERDICQFVPFRDYENAPPERFGSAVLAEVPGNIVEYFISREPPINPGQKPGLSAVSY